MYVKIKGQETLIKEGYFNDRNNNSGDWWESKEEYVEWFDNVHLIRYDTEIKYLLRVDVNKIIDIDNSIYRDAKKYDWAIEEYYTEDKYPELYI